MTRILHLTDLHLFHDPQARLKNVPTTESFRDVPADVRTRLDHWDLLVISGDIAQDENRQTYRLLRDELGEWLPRCRLLPGNHDNRAAMKEVFPEIGNSSPDFLAFAERLEDWVIIGLDTHWPGEVAGRIEHEQLKWFSEQLERAADRSVLVFMHHPPISVNSPWLDRIGLSEASAFQDVVRSRAQIRVIAAGHVHHVFEGKLGSADVLTTPSTALQFEPAGEESSYVNDPPGYRIFDLGPAGYRTEVMRLPGVKFPPRADD